MFGLRMNAAPSAAAAGMASAVVPQPVDAVFDFVARDFFANYQRWSTQVVELEPKGPTPVRPGVKAKQVTLERGMRSETTFAVAEVEPPRRLVLEGVSERFRSTYEFERRSDSETEVTFRMEMRELDLSMRPFAKLIGTALQEGAEQTVENIRSLLAEGAPCTERARAC
ncbi:MAG: SRPBCC family protein [Methylocystis sp.]|uniref:SRPBCC family protein n=1 Tax=Methylocystis sp. TaxID=1911079 RepID=UPI003DA5F7ED